MGRAWLYDGRNAVRRSVELSAAGDMLRLTEADGQSLEVPPQLLFHAQSRAGAETYGRSDLNGWRLTIEGPAMWEVERLLPSKKVYGGLIDRIGLPRAVVIGAAVSAALLFVFYSAPTWLAPLVPERVEKRMGDALVGDFGGKFCRGTGGQAALDKLAMRLGANPTELNVRVVDIKMVNAAALPGSNIVLFRELISEADGPDQVAGILAHEIAHVEQRHVTEAMIRQMGVGMIIALLGGGTGANADALLSAGHSRAAEREADEAALQALRRANISPLPTADFFARLAGEERKLGAIGAGLEYLSTHPLSSDREARFRQAAEKDRRYDAALSREEWESLFNICFNKPAS